MKRFENGEALAKEFGLKPEVLKKTFDEYNAICEDPKKDPFGKKVALIMLTVRNRTFILSSLVLPRR